MHKITSFFILSILLCSGTHAGLLRSRLAYSGGFPGPIPFAAGHHYGSSYSTTYAAPQFAAPLPVAPFNAPPPHPYGAIGYATPSVYKVRTRGAGFSPFSAYASVRSHHKFAYPAPVPSFYNAPPPVAYAAPGIPYADFEEPSTIVKFGPPITTTTTTYSTTAAATATAAALPVAPTLNAVAGW